MLSSLSNIYSDKAFVNSVLPTPVGPAKIKLAIGRFGFLNPTRARRIAFETAVTACSWPIILSWIVSSIFKSRSDSVPEILLTGIPVQLEITFEISVSWTVSISSRNCSLVCSFWVNKAFFIIRICVRTSISWSTNSFAISKSWFFILSSLSFNVSCNSHSNLCKPLGNLRFSNRTRAPASSKTSIALSGKKRSAIYFEESKAACSKALSW